jgi:hypothetical protein
MFGLSGLGTALPSARYRALCDALAASALRVVHSGHFGIVKCQRNSRGRTTGWSCASRTANSAQPVLLDLVFNPKKSEWRERIQNEWYSGNVVLRRPFVAHIGYRIIGDWIWGDPRASGYSCKHIALGSDSTLVIWSDIIDLPGVVVYPIGMSRPPSTPEWYGDLDMDPETKDIGLNLLFFTGTEISGDVVIGNVNQKATNSSINQPTSEMAYRTEHSTRLHGAEQPRIAAHNCDANNARPYRCKRR